MLTSEAFNALLKMLEEPPEHVIFILATTEPHKVPATIVSRCQRFDFMRLPGQNIFDHLKHVVQDENFSAADGALWRIVQAADGGMRDALSLLDQLRSFSGENISEEDVNRLLGSVPASQFLDLFAAIRSGKPEDIFSVTDRFVELGVHMMQVLRDFLQFARVILMHLAGAKGDIWLEEISRKRLTTLCAGLSVGEWREALDHLAKVEPQVRWHSAPRILFEVALLEVQEKLSSKNPSPVQTPNLPHREKWGTFLEKLRARDIEAAIALEEGEWEPNSPDGMVRVYFTKGSSYFVYLLNRSIHKTAIEDTLAEVLGVRKRIEYHIRSLLETPPPVPELVEAGTGSGGFTAEDIRDVFGRK